MSRVSPAEREAAIERLHTMVQPGDTLWTVLRDRSSSGMSRSIDVYKLYVTENGQIDRLWLSRLAATATGMKFDEKREAVRVQGAGMDMGFHLVYELSSVLYPEGFEGKSGGYALSQRWL